MSLTLMLQQEAGECVAAFRVTGTPVPGEARDLVSRLREGVPPEAEEVRLDLSGVTAMPDPLAAALTSLWRELQDRNVTLRVDGANVVVGWVLARHLGPAAATVLDDPRWSFPSGNDGTGSSDRAQRPVRDLAARLQRRLCGAADPAFLEQEVAAAMQQCGLAVRCLLVVRRGDRLHVVGHREVRPVPAGGWLGSLLAGVDCPLAGDEIDTAGLMLEEIALLKWADADLLVPLVDAGELQGVLLLRSGRRNGLSGYRSGELLALDLLGHFLASYLVAAAETAARAPTGGMTADQNPQAAPVKSDDDTKPSVAVPLPTRVS